MGFFVFLIFLGIVCFVFFVYKCFTSDWHKAAVFFDQHPEEMFDDDDEDDDDPFFYARQMEDEMIIAQDEYNLQMRNYESEAARDVPSQQNYSYEDLIFDEGAMFERLMDSGV